MQDDVIESVVDLLEYCPVCYGTLLATDKPDVEKDSLEMVVACDACSRCFRVKIVMEEE